MVGRSIYMIVALAFLGTQACATEAELDAIDCMLDQYENPRTEAEVVELAEVCGADATEWSLDDYDVTSPSEWWDYTEGKGVE